MIINFENSKITELDEFQLENTNGGSIELAIAAIGIAAICYYFGEHSAR